MYEEDRLNALAMYSKIFDDAEDEQILLNRLVSPTRQAVIVARSYNAKEHKLQVHAQSREDGDRSGSTSPDYIRVINQVAEDVLADQRKQPEVDVNQFSLFEENIAVESEEEAAPAAIEAPLAAPTAEEEVPEAPAQEPDQVDAFLSDFTIPAEVLAMQDTPAEPERAAEMQEQAEDDAAPVSPVFPEEDVQDSLITDAEEEPEYSEDAEEQEPQRKAKVFALILYIIFAIPITLIGLVLLLIPTLLSLAIAAAAIAGGVFLITSAFSGFAIFADIMMVLGGALVLLALGLFFLWLFIWFIGGAMVGLVRGIISLAKKWCYKEVEAE